MNEFKENLKFNLKYYILANRKNEISQNLTNIINYEKTKEEILPIKQRTKEKQILLDVNILLALKEGEQYIC